MLAAELSDTGPDVVAYRAARAFAWALKLRQRRGQKIRGQLPFDQSFARAWRTAAL